MVSKATLLQALPPFRNQTIVIDPINNSKTIEAEMTAAHNLYKSDYDKIYKYFDTGNVYSDAQTIWNFLKYNLRYDAEDLEEQSSKSPSAILQSTHHIDCKHYSLFAGGVLDAIRRNEGDAWEWYYRFVSDKSKKFATHVFVVVFDGNREIYIDPVLTSFNQQKSWKFTKDVDAMTLVRISGVNDEQPQQMDAVIKVNKQAAFTNFLIMENLNLFSLKDLMAKNPEVTQGAFKQYCERNGFDYNQAMLILNAQ